MDASQILFEMYDRLGTWESVANEIGCNKGLCWQVAMGKTQSNKVERALGLRRKRIRLAADVTEEQKAALQAAALDVFGMSWSELCQDLGQYLIDGGLSYAIYDYFEREVRMVES